ncbi:MAG: hypothetical protein IJ794_03165 [Lachnospiraceae bacterium]|nr:hypothetical protein [Lachnospiraceae bacterium]
MDNKSNPLGKPNAFDQALSNFIHDFANGGAIRHLADAGLTVTEIAERLSFPTPKSRVAKEVWRYYLEMGKVRLEKPETGLIGHGADHTNKGGKTASNKEDCGTDIIRKVTYVKEQNAYGRVSMRQVVEEIPVDRRTYIACDFGKQMYQDREQFLQKLETLSTKERQYILDLPWPLETVYHEADERMQNIMKKLEE